MSGWPGAAVVEHDGGVGEQPADEEVPHHPARRGEPEDPVARLAVHVQPEFLEVLDEDPALALDDRLGQARGARRVQHPERVVERDALELEGALAEEALLPARAVEVAQAHQRSADLPVDPLDDLRSVEVAPVVAVAVDGEQDLRLDLREAVDDAAGAEVRRAARPDRTEARRRQERGDRLRDVRDVGRDAVAGPDAERAQPGRDPGHLRAQLSPGDLGPLAQLGGVDDRQRLVALAAERMLGVVHPRAGEPLGAGHAAVAQHRVVGAVNGEKVPDRGPEALQVLDRPRPQLVVVPEVLVEPAHVARHRGALDQLLRRLPELRRHGAASWHPCCER
jgi:hypothetical protein